MLLEKHLKYVSHLDGEDEVRKLKTLKKYHKKYHIENHRVDKYYRKAKVKDKNKILKINKEIEILYQKKNRVMIKAFNNGRAI